MSERKSTEYLNSLFTLSLLLLFNCGFCRQSKFHTELSVTIKKNISEMNYLKTGFGQSEDCVLAFVIAAKNIGLN